VHNLFVIASRNFVCFLELRPPVSSTYFYALCLFCFHPLSLAYIHTCVCLAVFLRGIRIHQARGREPMTREPDVALLMTASSSLDILLTRLLRMKLFL